MCRIPQMFHEVYITNFDHRIESKGKKLTNICKAYTEAPLFSFTNIPKTVTSVGWGTMIVILVLSPCFSSLYVKLAGTILEPETRVRGNTWPILFVSTVATTLKLLRILVWSFCSSGLIKAQTTISSSCPNV